MPERVVHIYRLVDPRDDRTRYVGWTVRPLDEALAAHVTDRGNDRKCRWVRELRGEDEVPGIELIEDAGRNWRARASHWTAFHGNAGHLVNPREPGVPPITGQRGKLARIMSDGMVRRRADLQAAGLSQATLDRAIRDGTLERTGTSGVVLATAEAGPMEAIARRFAGTEDTPRGVLCLHAAARVHGLTTITSRQRPIEVAIPRSLSNTDGGLPVRLVRLSSAQAFMDGVEWTEAAPGNWMACTTAARTVADMFSPWGNPTEGSDVLALEALDAEGGAEAVGEALGFAERLGWGAAMKSALAGRRACATSRR